MGLQIELRDHPGKRHVKVSRTDARHLFHCGKCNDNVVEPRNRPPGRKVRCDTCGETCEPLLVNALPDQHGIYIDGKCVGYCTREKDAEVWFVEQLDPYIQDEVAKLIEKKYGGEPVTYPLPKVDFPDELDAADDDETEAGNDFDDEED